MSSFLKDVSRVGLSNIFIIFFGLGTSIVTARFIGPEGNGIIAGLLVYPSLFMSFGSLGIRQSTTYFLGKSIYSEDQIKVAISQIWMISTLFSVIISFFLIRYFSKTGDNLNLVILALLPIPFTLFNTYNSGIFLGKNDIKTFNKINWIPSLIALLSTIIFVLLLKMDVQGAMIASISAPLFMSILLLFKNKFIKFFSIKYEWKIIKDMLSLGSVYAVALLVINLNYKVDIIILDKLSIPYEMGIYSKGSAITQYLWQIPMIFSTIVFVRSAVSKNDVQFSHKVAQLLRLSFLAIGIGSLVLYLFSEQIIIGMYGEPYQESVEVLNYLLPGVLILTIYKVMNMDLAGKGKPWISMKAMLPALGINIFFNFILIPSYGANGAAIASTISYAIAGIFFLHFYSLEVGIRITQILTYKKSDFDPILNIINKVKN
ncbi:oligosaccharide flippase family protein [Algoriphagus marinus]|uniref:oligosaccharide flippase family protein n=1 Tax=Algoriphagus marinus TaxID=1925762 RepID=UPI00094B98A6|nr:polysaccharide biosynthesis C-terminal domain-containing protein [Algoriphagus marinus]